MLEPAVAPLPSVSLEELDRRAALQRRVDNKYLVPWARFETLVGELGGDHEVLAIDGRRVFAYDSVYFDTPDLRSFRDHVDQRRPRIKVRSRLYADSGLCSFELKVKREDGETIKESFDQDPADHGRLTPAAREFLARHLGEPPDLRPTLVTRFQRATLAERDGAERVTCDTGVELIAPERGAVRLVDSHVVVEAKSESGDEAADGALRATGLEAVSLSKYRVGVSLLLAEDPEPQLGGNPARWFPRC